jgi:hypothetical protein
MLAMRLIFVELGCGKSRLRLSVWGRLTKYFLAIDATKSSAQQLLLVVLFGSILQANLRAQISSITQTENRTSKAVEPHPWLKDVPVNLARLVDVGNVQIEVNEKAVRAANRTALTEFSFQFQYRMRYRPVFSAEPGNSNSSTSYRVRLYDIEWRLQHRISLSESYRPSKPWVSTLLLHEFDHVAVSTDPRLAAIVESLENSEVIVAVKESSDRRILKMAMDQAVAEYAKKFQVSIEKLVNKNYVKLDDKSQNGLTMIDDRGRFFQSLYSVEALRREEFPYLAQVSKAIERVQDKSLKEHYSVP